MSTRLRAGDRGLDVRPDLDEVVRTLMAYGPGDAAQGRFRVQMLAFAGEHPNALHRNSVTGHFTASGLLLDHAGERALLTHHRKLGRWLQLGGHCDGDGNLAGVALRENQEESGLTELEIDPRVVDLDVHPIPARPGEPEHLHLDVRFLLFAPAGAEPERNHESKELRWVRPDELDGLELDDSVHRLFRIAFPGH